MSTRILSVFKYLKQVEFAVLFLAVSSNANGQLPIDWNYAPEITAGHDECWYIEATPTGGCIFAGQAQRRGSREDAWIGELDSAGNLVRERFYGWDDNLRCYNALKLSDGGYLLLGSSYSGEHAGNAWAMRVDSEFDTLWSYERLQDDYHYEYFFGAYEMPNGDIALCGTDGTVNHEAYLLFVVLAPSGEQIWYRLYWEGFGATEGYHVQPTPDGGFLVIGLCRYSTISDISFLISYRLDSNGSVRWQRNLSAAAFERATMRATRTADGGCIVAGLNYLIRLNADGDSLWERHFSYVPLRTVQSAIELSDGGFLAAGSIRFAPDERDEACIVRTDRDGNTLWTQAYGDSTNEQFLCLAQSADNAFFFGGFGDSWGNYGQWEYDPDLWIVKTEVDSNLPSDVIVPPVIPANDFNLHSCYPNPFNSTLTIRLDVPSHRDVTLSLYDLLGREVQMIHQGVLISNTVTFTAPATLSSGVYFVQANMDGASQMQKVVLLK